ncbi:MAG: hypothetical protein PWP51_890 [Clostridiales bacterium]|jgi:signal transduction histidine kinase|nr:hypothetical protein [Clostridiales bacterium]MDN5298337.1 hypothetical protein [Clostridiales bacterium]
MRSSSVVIRLFVVTTFIFVVFVTIAFVIQLRSFETYYFDLKIKDIDAQYESFEKLYDEAKWNQTLLDQNVQYFENKNNVKVALVDYHYGIINEQKYKIFVMDTKGQVYEVELNEVFTAEDYLSLSVNRGDEIDVYGYLWGDGLSNISLMQMKINGVMVFDGIDPKVRGKLSLDHISGTVLSLRIPDEDDLIYGAGKNSLATAVDKYYFNQGDLNITDNSFIFSDYETGREYIVKVFNVGDATVKSIFFMTDQQPIIEATTALKSFYPALITGVFIVGAVMMFFLIFSISNPLYDIERKAEKLVQLDFTEYLEIKHNDEIGRLSKSLNHLSYNLENSLKALSEANEKLVEDMAKDREVEHMRKEFIRNVSHDFKTPLGVIRAFTEGLEDGVLEEDLSYYAGIILDEVETLEALVNDMLELSKLQTGAYTLDIEEFHFNTMVEGLIEKSQKLASKKQIELVFQGASYDLVYGDYRKLSRAVQNFIANAIQYGDAGTEVTLVTTVIERRIRFEIYNHCAPIPEAYLEKVWVKFFRADESRTKSGSGSGLGLAITKEILEQHQCKYGVANTESGVVFYFEMDKYVNYIV